MNTDAGKTERVGDWCQTFTGRQFWPMDPRAEDVCIEDIAHALALQCRFAGHCREPYSVAEHSVRAAEYVRGLGGDAEEVLAALLHDASEAYCIDVPRPLKPWLAGYKAIERDVMLAVERWANLFAGACESPLVKRADEVLLMTEARDLLTAPPAPWGTDQGGRVAPLAEVIVPWDWRVTESRFLARFDELVGGDVARDPRGLHYHACPNCYRHMPCTEGCTIEGDLCENGVNYGSHARCDDCGPEADHAE